MKTIILSIKHFYLIYKNSNKTMLMTPIIFLLIYLFFIKKHVNIYDENYTIVMTSMGILTTFFFISIEKLNLNDIEFRLNKEVIRKKLFSNTKIVYTQGKILKNTFFALIINSVLLVFTVFLLFLFNIRIYELLLLNIIYIMFGFIYSVLIWSFNISV